MAGRRPKPTKLKLLQNTLQKCRANPREPQPDPAMPQRPKYVKGQAAREWKYLVKELGKTRVLTLQDRALLSLFCVTHAAIIEAIESGRELSASLLAQCRLLGEGFGLSPASRSRTHAAVEPQEENEWQDLLAKRK